MKFFTLPPKEIKHPFILINARNPKFSYLKAHTNIVSEVIIDSGIEIFRDPNVKDYPRNWIWRLIKIYRKVEKIVSSAEIWLTCPDYCDDYHPKSLWINNKITNIERTVNNVKNFIFFPKFSFSFFSKSKLLQHPKLLASTSTCTKIPLM